MAARKKLIVGNWKMNFTVHEASIFVHKLAGLVTPKKNVEVVLAPSALALPTLGQQIDHKQFNLAAQNFYWRDEGAFTGEISAHQLHGVVKYAIVGHSERRHVFGETDKDIRAKVQAAVRNEIIPILCVGETAAEHTEGETNAILHDQLIGGLANLTSEEVAEMVIAYEPVWAIGTGDNAAPSEVGETVKAIRRQIAHLYGKKVAEAVLVLYGGSVTSGTAGDYLTTVGIDGLLVGGASLRAEEFNDILEKASKA